MFSPLPCTTEGTIVEWKARTFDAPAQLFFYDTEFDTSIPLLLSYYSPAAAFEISNQAFFKTALHSAKPDSATDHYHSSF